MYETKISFILPFNTLEQILLLKVPNLSNDVTIFEGLHINHQSKKSKISNWRHFWNTCHR